MAQNVWGGCFNERGWDKLMQLTEEERSHILDLLFDPNEPDGLHLTMARMPIGSSDFAMDLYSLNETENDYEMENFSIERDKEKLIPYIKEALKRQPNLNKAYALYFRKFIEAYDNEGIEIYMVSPQNEPTMWTLYSSCRWTGDQLRDFIKGYLGPQMKELGVQIYLGTFTNSDDSLMDPTLNDIEAKKYISGINFQWWSYNKARSLYHTGFEQGMMQSETMCGNGNNDWQYAEYQFDVMYMYFSYGISAYNMWNMVLEWDGVNPGGYNTATPPWPQNAPITVNETTKEYVINPQYYNIKHYSDAVKPNARRIESGGNYNSEYIPGQNADEERDTVYSAEQREIAFRNPDGTISLLVKNGSNSPKKVDINFNGRRVSAELPAHSINTFTTQGTPLTGNETDMRTSISKDKIVSIKNAQNGRALCIDGGGAKTLANVIAWDYSGQANQQWYLQAGKVGEQDTVKLMNMKSFHLAAVDGGSMNENTKLIIWQDTKEENQNWIMETSGEYVKFKNVTSGLYLTLESDQAAAKAVQKAATDSQLQLWKVENAYDLQGIPTVNSVSAAPQNATVKPGESLQFTAAVEGVNNAPETVNWTIDGNKSYSTAISRSGLLKVAKDETAEQITVRAASTFDVGKSCKVIVKVGEQKTPPPKPPAKKVPKKNTVHKIGTLYYKVTKSASKNGTVTVTKPVKKTYTSVTVPATIKINGYTFKVTAIGSKAFQKNAKLKTVTIGNNVTTIGTLAFAADKKLTKVTLGTGITTIGSKAFYQDSKLKTVNLKSGKLKSVKNLAFKGIAKKAKVDVPNKKVKNYKKLLKKAGLSNTATVK